jgi:hypothetical protein
MFGSWGPSQSSGLMARVEYPYHLFYLYTIKCWIETRQFLSSHIEIHSANVCEAINTLK